LRPLRRKGIKEVLKKLVILALATLSVTALAHEVPCPVCGLKVVQSTDKQDNEVVLRFGKKKIEYRCVYCALSDSENYKGDLVVYAPSETKGKPVLLKRTSGKWSVVKESDGKLVPEEGVVFMNAFTNHAKCGMLSRAFHTKDGFDKYAAVNDAPKAKPLTLDEMVAVAQKH
jgi:hypothetical protein